jgi:hypothetical protein
MGNTGHRLKFRLAHNKKRGSDESLPNAIEFDCARISSIAGRPRLWWSC